MGRSAIRLSAVGLVAGLLASGPLAAQTPVRDAMKDLPGWKVPDICAKDSAQGHCLALESRAWRSVSGSWVALPDDVKRLCLSNARQPSDQSWRVLHDCVDEEMEKRGDKRAVATRATPGEAVPAARPVVTASAIPAPPLGLPTAPPPFALAAEADAKRAADAKAAADADAARKATADADAKRAADAKSAADAAAKAAADAATRRAADAKAAADADAARKAAAAADAKRAADAKAAADAAAKAAADAATRRAADAKAAADADAARKASADAEAKRQAAVAVAKACQDDLQQIAKAGVIRFTFGSVALDRASNETVQKLAASVAKCPGHVIRVDAHTDAMGEEAFNMNLSQRRAQTVVDALVKQGVASDLIKAEGFGETKPIADNETQVGRAQNRRIDFTVLPK